MKMSHLTADTQEELRLLARSLGLEKYLQHMGTYKFHLDVSIGKRKIAIEKLGAKPVTMVQMGCILQDRWKLWHSLGA